MQLLCKTKHAYLVNSCKFDFKNFYLRLVLRYAKNESFAFGLE